MIRFDHVTKILGSRKVLDDFNLEIKKGEVFVIVGPSGVGKSVTLKHMVRLLTPNSGSVIVGGENISEARDHELERIRNKFGYLFQGGALLAWLTVAENVALPLREHTDLSDEVILEKVRTTLALVGLENDMEKMPSDISGGMCKRAGLARAIIRDPHIILYDEPTSGLDPVTARTIDALIQRLNREFGVTTVVVTHDLHSALTIANRIALLNHGKIVEMGTPEEFVKSQQPDVQHFLEAQFITKRGIWERSLA